MNTLLQKYKKLPIQVRGSIWFAVCTFMKKGISVLTTPIFTRLLTTSEYGQYSVFYSWMTILTVFMTLSLVNGVYPRGIVKFEEERNSFISSMQGLTFTLVIVWTAVYLLYRDYWERLLTLTKPQVLAMIALIWANVLFSFWSVEQRTEYKYKALVVVTILVSVAKPMLSIILILISEDKVTARIMGMVIVELTAFSWIFFYHIHRGRVFYSRKFWKHAILFSIPLIPHYLSESILSNADRIMIRDMVDESAAGIYSLAYSIALIMTFFNSALMQTFEPWLYKRIKEKQVNRIKEVAYPSFGFIAFINLLLICFTPEVLHFFAPKEYWDAIWVVPSVCMSSLFTFAYLFFYVFEIYFEKTKYIAISTIASGILNIILNYLFIRIFGYYAASYTTLFCYIAYASFHYVFTMRICKEEFPGEIVYDTLILVRIGFGFISAGIAIMLTYNFPMLRYLIIFLITLLLLAKRNVVIKYITDIVYLRKPIS